MLSPKKIYVGKGIQSRIIIDSNVIIDTFDPSSPNYETSYKFMDHIVGRKVLFAMPMHGWFEITCTLNRIKKNKRIVPPIFDGKPQMPVEFIHIDDQFLQNYVDVGVPSIKAMDYLFLVVAKKNDLPLVTWDKPMTKAASECGIQVYNPKQWMDKNVIGHQ